MKNSICEINDKSSVSETVIKFRNQALCIKTNVQILKDIWTFQPNFKEKNAGAFYQIIQDNCIFRIVLETYKMLLDSKNGSMTIRQMANDCYKEMIKMEVFHAKQQELLCMKRKFAAELSIYKDIEDVIKNNRNKVYAHNDKKYHWFSKEYLKFGELTDEIYDRILEVSDVCIEYCNNILQFFSEKPILEYSNHDDVKRLFGIKTEHDKEIQRLNRLFYGET